MSNVTVGITDDINIVKGWTKVLQTAPGCQLEINDSQLATLALTDLCRKETTVRVLKEEKRAISLKTLENSKCCDIRIHVHDDDEEAESRLIWSPSRIDKERLNFGAMVIYNPVVTDIIGKFPQIAVPIYWASYPSSKIPKIVLPDTDNIFVPFQDQISHNRFVSESNKKRIQENAPRLLTYFNDYLYKIWAPILVDNFQSSYQLPKRPKKPDVWICNKDPGGNHRWIFNTLIKCTFPNLKVDPNDDEELLIALIKKASDGDISKLEKLFRKIIGDEIYLREINMGKDVLRTIEPGIADEVDKVIETRYGVSAPTEPTEPKTYEDSLSGFFEMLKDM
jgi:hypothetical protein